MHVLRVLRHARIQRRPPPDIQIPEPAAGKCAHRIAHAPRGSLPVCPLVQARAQPSGPQRQHQRSGHRLDVENSSITITSVLRQASQPSRRDWRQPGQSYARNGPIQLGRRPRIIAGLQPFWSVLPTALQHRSASPVSGQNRSPEVKTSASPSPKCIERGEPSQTVISDVIGGAEGDRTPDLRIANATLSQLSYGPDRVCGPFHGWRGLWAAGPRLSSAAAFG